MPSSLTAGRFFRYLNMDYLIAPVLIRLIYWIGIIAIVSAGIGLMLSSRTANMFLAFSGMMLSLLLWRLLSEMLVLAFNLHSRLIEIRDLLSHRQDATEEEQHTPPPLFLLKKAAHPFDDQGTA